MSEVIFSVFPSENFVDLGLYQFGWEQCDPSHSFGPAARNHYLFHLCLSGTGTLIADNTKENPSPIRSKADRALCFFQVRSVLILRTAKSLGICLGGI